MISDTVRNLSVITGLIFSGAIAVFVFIIGKLPEYFKKKKATPYKVKTCFLCKIEDCK